MQRMTGRLRRRLRGERGASAVLFALLLVPVLGFTAIAVDIGAVYAQKARLQTAADAAALAVAQDCARGACGNGEATASAFVTANEGGAIAAPPVISAAQRTVTVVSRKAADHWFAPALGIDSTVVSASATVTWDAPSGATAALPLIFSWCEFAAQTGGGLPSTTIPRTILLPKKSDTGCTGPSHKFVPGGFGWLVPDPGRCAATTKVGDRFDSEPGNNPSKDCSPAHLQALVGQTVLLPIFDQAGGTGNHAWYHVYGYAAFTITAYYFAGQYSHDKPCSGSERCIRGYFTRFVPPADAITYSPTAPALGAWVCHLTR